MLKLPQYLQRRFGRVQTLTSVHGFQMFFLEDLPYRFLTRGVGKWVFNWNPALGCPWCPRARACSRDSVLKCSRLPGSTVGCPGAQFRLLGARFRLPRSTIQVAREHDSGCPGARFGCPGARFGCPGARFRLPGSTIRVPRSTT